MVLLVYIGLGINLFFCHFLEILLEICYRWNSLPLVYYMEGYLPDNIKSLPLISRPEEP